MKTYSSYFRSIANGDASDGDIVRHINSSTTDNLAWGMEMINDAIRYLVTKYYFNERTYTTTSVASQQFYNLPPQVKKLINTTVTVGSVLWQPKECPTRQYWDALNVITFQQDFPSYFFIYNGQLGIYPTPASNGNTITMNYKTRVVDLTMADVTQATNSTTISITTNTPTVTATGATFLNWMVGQWIQIPFSSTNSTDGDNNWYQIKSVTSSTVLVLDNNYTGATVSGASFTIGQVPILPEDYQDLPLYRMAMIYYTTRFPDEAKATLYKGFWDDGVKALNDEFGSKTSNVILNATDEPIINPNLFQRSIG